jgi:heme oxygenase
MPPLLSQLREATSASHASLDSAFGSLDLATKADYVRFLSGHAMGIAPLFASFRSFVEDELHLTCPDYPAMLHDDLAALGTDAVQLPRVSPSAALTPSAVGYVIAGSRLGLAAIRRHGYWGRVHDLPSAYMEDDLGLTIWKETAAKLKHIVPDETDAAHEAAAAVAAFDTFSDAFKASAIVLVR